MQSIFPLLFLSGSFWNPFSNESWHSTFLQYFLRRGSRRDSDRRMTAVKVPQSGKVFCSQLIEKSYLGLRFVCFINNVLWLQGSGQLCDLHLQQRYLIWHRWLFLQSFDRRCWWRWIQATFKGPIICFLSFSIMQQLRKEHFLCIFCR